MIRLTNRTQLWLLVFAAIVFLTGCAAREEAPVDLQTPVKLPESFAQTGGAAVSDRWWRSFDDPQLDQLVSRALAGNFNLKASFQRLRQSRAIAQRQSASLFPSVEANAGAQRQESDTLSSDTFSAGLNASYELDLWGRVQSLAEAEELRASATLANYQAAAVTLSGEVANAWFQLVEQRAQFALAQSQLETNQNVLKVIESRFATGQGGSADVLRQRQLVSVSRERLSSIGADMMILEHQLAVLMGQSPGGAAVPASATLPPLPALPDTGVPLTLIQRRPDLQQAWRLVRAADQDLAAAISNRFPRVSIEASVSSQSESAGDLFDDWLTTLAGNLIVPLIDGGQRRAEVRRSEAVLDEQVQAYGQAVLTAIQEVEDALAREEQLRQRLDSLENRVRLAETTYRQLRNQYLNGAVSYLEVLTALQDRQDLQRTILNTHQQLLTSRVGLYRALAGPIAITESQDNGQTETVENTDA
jgi:NodT family efflux transporter outer membrane factor (OMF) lipoprotein